MNIQDKIKYLTSNSSNSFKISAQNKASAISYQAIINKKLADNSEELIKKEDYDDTSVDISHKTDFQTLIDQHRMQSLKQYRDYISSLSNAVGKEKIKKI